MINILGTGQQAGAAATMVPGVIVVTFYTNDLLILHIQLYAAAAMAARAGGPRSGGNYAVKIILTHLTPPTFCFPKKILNHDGFIIKQNFCN